MIVISENEPSDEALGNFLTYLFEIIKKKNLYDKIKEEIRKEVSK